MQIATCISTTALGATYWLIAFCPTSINVHTSTSADENLHEAIPELDDSTEFLFTYRPMDRDRVNRSLRKLFPGFVINPEGPSEYVFVYTTEAKNRPVALAVHRLDPNAELCDQPLVDFIRSGFDASQLFGFDRTELFNESRRESREESDQGSENPG